MPLGLFDGRFNMAEDARLLVAAEAGKAGWRVYGWDGPWVSLGHYQSPERDLLDPERIPWVMRPTGGKAVLHGHDVTVGLAVPLEELSDWSDESNRAGPAQFQLSRSLKTVYRLAIRPILEAMRTCGVPVVLGEEFRNPAKPHHRETFDRRPSTVDLSRSSDCFAVVSPNDVVDARTGLKVCGCALKLTQTSVLVQASVPVGTPLVDPRAVFARAAVLAALPWDHEAFPEAFAAAMAIRAAVSAVG